MKTEFDERVKDYWKLPSARYIVKLGLDEEISKEIEDKNTTFSQQGVFIPSIHKRNMNDFIVVIKGLKTNFVFYQDTDSL